MVEGPQLSHDRPTDDSSQVACPSPLKNTAGTVAGNISPFPWLSSRTLRRAPDEVRVPPAPSLSGSLIGRDLLFAPPLACHPETIRRGWLKDLNYRMTDQQMIRARWPAPALSRTPPARSLETSRHFRGCHPERCVEHPTR